MTEELVSRLESVTQRLERVARKLGGGGDDSSSIPEYVTDYDKFMSTELNDVLLTTSSMKFPEAVSDNIKNGFNCIASLIRKLPNSKKPSPQEIMEFLKPCSGAIEASDKMKYRGKEFRKYGDHYKAVYEFVNSLQWVLQNPSVGQLPAKHVEGQLQATDFNLLRVLKNNKDETTKKWVQALKKANKKQLEYVKEYFKTGLTWNPKGNSLSSAKEESKTQETSKTSKTTKKSTTKKSGNTGQLFSELNRGNIGAKGFGLRKVKDNEKTKNRKPEQRSGKVVMKKAVKKTTRKKGNPGMSKRGFRMLVENYSEGIHTVEGADLKSNVYITMCDDSVFEITKKVKSVSVDNCIKCRVFISDVVSAVELVNCKSVTIICQGICPSIAVDKSNSPKIILTKKSFLNPPDIYTSNISAMNVEIPGKTEKDDNREIPVPEQFVSKINNKTGEMTTTIVKHG